MIRSAALLALLLALAAAAAWYFGESSAPQDARPAAADAVSTNATAAPAALPPRTAPPAPPPTADAPPALPKTDDPATLDQVGRAELAQGIEARKDGKSAKARELLEAAAVALSRAIELSGEHVDPWTLQSMAQAQLELGNGIDAVNWADRALQRLRLGSSDDYQTFRAAALTMNVGIVYFRAGQRQTGIAYMDQAISMAPTAFDRADFVDLKQETLGGS